MKTPLSPLNQPFKAWLGLCLASGVLWGGPWATLAAAPVKTWPIRDFLPPIASINPRVQEKSAQQPADNDLDAIALTAVTTPVIRTTPKVNRLSDDLGGNFQSDQLQTVVAIQKKVDEADLEHLWKATVEKNPVIHFSLEKLATPADLQTKQSSKFLNRTLSVLISGAAMGSTLMPGGGAYRNMASMATGNALQNLVEGKTQPTVGCLSPTEQIQMAGLIDELKLKLIHNYQDYKNTLQSLAQSHEITIRNNNLYSKALASHNDLGIMAAGSAYYQSLINETTLRQKAKHYRLELERLAGQQAVSELQLAVDLPDSVASSSTTLPPASDPKLKEDINPGNAEEIGPALPQALEIGPSLSAETSFVGPLPQSTPVKPGKKIASKKARKALLEEAMPGPIPDKILQPKEIQP